MTKDALSALKNDLRGRPLPLVRHGVVVRDSPTYSEANEVLQRMRINEPVASDPTL